MARVRENRQQPPDQDLSRQSQTERLRAPASLNRQLQEVYKGAKTARGESIGGSTQGIQQKASAPLLRRHRVHPLHWAINSLIVVETVAWKDTFAADSKSAYSAVEVCRHWSQARLPKALRQFITSSTWQQAAIVLIARHIIRRWWLRESQKLQLASQRQAATPPHWGELGH